MSRILSVPNRPAQLVDLSVDELDVAAAVAAYREVGQKPSGQEALLAPDFEATFARLYGADFAHLVAEFGPLRDRATVSLHSAPVPDKLIGLYSERVVPLLRVLGGRGKSIRATFEKPEAASDPNAVASVVMVLALVFEAAALSNLTALAIAMMRSVSNRATPKASNP